jgi:hypothetical protein
MDRWLLCQLDPDQTNHERGICSICSPLSASPLGHSPSSSSSCSSPSTSATWVPCPELESAALPSLVVRRWRKLFKSSSSRTRGTRQLYYSLVKKQSVIPAGPLDQPLHSSNDVVPRRQLAWIGRVVGEYDNIRGVVAEALWWSVGAAHTIRYTVDSIQHTVYN